MNNLLLLGVDPEAVWDVFPGVYEALHNMPDAVSTALCYGICIVIGIFVWQYLLTKTSLILRKTPFGQNLVIAVWRLDDKTPPGNGGREVKAQ